MIGPSGNIVGRLGAAVVVVVVVVVTTGGNDGLNKELGFRGELGLLGSPGGSVGFCASTEEGFSGFTGLEGLLGSTGTNVGLCSTPGAGPGVLVEGMMGSNGDELGRLVGFVGLIDPA